MIVTAKYDGNCFKCTGCDEHIGWDQSSHDVVKCLQVLQRRIAELEDRLAEQGEGSGV